ncbi:hypothetical protein [Arthrobacter sp. PsM3]|uniref:hypothetical protein n=1 Tax=Arthrobacter sp. PsM3 TaxID=3030531 RepID=UPI00263B4294|nr:hypothetical protein [Arthrobacter sp. PsM3]MDN4644188.1 hypothetical protein [Arthrobacter sp. PsM3]
MELVKRHRVLSQAYEAFDVRCARSRWWVITNLTNLYSQDQFRTADEAFSFHVGLAMRLWERDRVTVETEPRSVSETAWRKYAVAVEALGEANDAEDYQAVGVRLREAMIALVKDQAAHDWVADISDPPQLANIKDWLQIFAVKMTSKRRQRAYVRAIWEKTWDLVVHLQHDSTAVAWDAELAVNAVNHALEGFMYMRVNAVKDGGLRCPLCQSHRFAGTLNWGSDGELMEWDECSACRYATEPAGTGVRRS